MGNTAPNPDEIPSDITARQVIEKFGSGTYLQGKTAIVTGGNSGIGLETCKALSSAGCKVILCSRNIQAGQEAIDKEIANLGLGNYSSDPSLVFVKELDLCSLKSIKKFAHEIIATEHKIDYMVCNAGVMAIMEYETTEDGFEKQTGVNHFGHAYLVSLLLHAKIVKPQSPSSIVVLSSTAHDSVGNIDLNDLHYSKGRQYSAWGAYGQSKLCNVLYAQALAEHVRGTDVSVVSVHPGVIKTNLWNNSSDYSKGIMNYLLGKIVLTLEDKTIPQGAAGTVYGCLAPEFGGQNFKGDYLVNCKITPPKIPKCVGDEEKPLKDMLWEETFKQLNEKSEGL